MCRQQGISTKKNQIRDTTLTEIALKINCVEIIYFEKLLDSTVMKNHGLKVYNFQLFQQDNSPMVTA